MKKIVSLTMRISRLSFVLEHTLTSWSAMLMVTLGLFGCLEREAQSSFIVTQVSPVPVAPSTQLTIEGRGFGSTASDVSISARPLIIETWSDQKIVASLPEDTPRGERFLVVSREGQQTVPFPIFVEGELSSRPQGGRPEFGVINDDTPPLDLEPRDMTPDVDPPDMPADLLTVTLDDPNAQVILEAELRNQQGTEELWVHIIARDPQSLNLPNGWGETPLWGAAAQLNFPDQKLRFIRMALEDGINATALSGEVSGRVYWYHGNLSVNASAIRTTLMTLRFERLNPQDNTPITLGFVPRFSSIRGLQNQRLNQAWSGGTISFDRQGVTP